MSQDNNPIAIRAVALAEAVKFYVALKDPNHDAPEIVVDTAAMFLSFLNGTPAEELGRCAVASEKPAAEKPKAEKPKAEKPKAAPKPEPTGPTKDEVGAVVEKLLKANLRDEAIAVLKKYGANSVSGLMATGKADEAYGELQALLIAE